MSLTRCFQRFPIRVCARLSAVALSYLLIVVRVVRGACWRRFLARVVTTVRRRHNRVRRDRRAPVSACCWQKVARVAGSTL